jgi:hypothetical protein
MTASRSGGGTLGEAPQVSPSSPFDLPPCPRRAGIAQEKTGKLTAAKRTYLKTQAEAREAEIEIGEG